MDYLKMLWNSMAATVFVVVLAYCVVGINHLLEAVGPEVAVPLMIGFCVFALATFVQIINHWLDT